MPEVNHFPLCYPPQFPILGRLPRRPELLQQNIKRQSRWERDHQNDLSVAAGRRISMPCCKTLHISLCFDGTGNNLNNDLYESGDTPHPTNIARLFRASIGDGYVGGTSHNPKARWLTDAEGTGAGQYYKYYMPGVGTPFPEVGDLDYGNYGLAFAGYGEERINWGLMMIIDALRRALKMPRQDNDSLRAAVQAMGTSHVMDAVSGGANRRRQFYTQFSALLKPLKIAMQPSNSHCQLLGVKLYVYGFSRGAAAARAFVSWLNGLLSVSEAKPSLKMEIGEEKVVLPISVEYLGLLDTVASVGLANLLPATEGHMSWADGSQQLPDSELVKRCLHIVASHEQRLCFPLDSIRRETGEYPVNSVEVLYPGVHSDQGGGYPPGDQGKALAENDALLLSQIALNDLYADAFAHGAPLKVPKVAWPISRRNEPWRVMDPENEREFAVSPTLVNRFNAWREITLGLPPASETLPDEGYEPLPANETLEQALQTQMAWITAWRIDRYAFASLKHAPFYLQASDTQADPANRAAAKAERDQRQADIVKIRHQQQANERYGRAPKRPLPPGYKDFDPDMAQTQLREAAEEFGEDYRTGIHLDTVALLASKITPVAGLVEQVIADVRAERERMKAQGDALVKRLFPPLERSRADERWRTWLDDLREAEANKSERLLCELFDDQVHDSRAWFLYAFLMNLPGVNRREPFGSYLRDRMVFFGNTHSRKLALYGDNHRPIPSGDPRLAGLEQPMPPQPVAMSAERLAEVHKAIDAQWDAYYAHAGEAKNAPV
ncbi:T6SS phospholipase effector Tle1-like catalytic domain-containing protein [Pseudomonas caspiana]